MGAGTGREQLAWGRCYQRQRKGGRNTLASTSFQSSNSASTATPAWKPVDGEIYFPEMQSRIEERWGMDLRANRHMISTRRYILKTLKRQVGIS